MELIFSSDCLLHNTGGHPECIERLDSFRDLPDNVAPSGESFLNLIHTDEHINKVKQSCHQSIPLDNDTLTSPNSFVAACAAVGAGITAASTQGFALVRPPGHHAYPSKATGFCLFNNIAIAVQYLINQGKRVLILDIDGHLGDGTSSIFYDNPDVLFCSLHQYPAFPGFGWIDEIGAGKGKGFTINIPLPPGSGDDLFNKGLDYLLPITKNFNPDIVAVSAGFDAHQLDPLLQLRLSLDCYYQIGNWLKSNFNEVFAVLEGGYHLEILPKAIVQFVNGINGIAPEYMEGNTTSDSEIQSVFNSNLDQLQQIIKDYWPV